MQVAAGWIMLFALDHLALEHVHVLAGRVRVDVWPAAAGRHLPDPRAHAGGAGQVAATATGADLDRRDVRGDPRQRQEERRVGQEWDSTCRTRWMPEQ